MLNIKDVWEQDHETTLPDTTETLIIDCINFLLIILILEPAVLDA